MHQHTFVVLAFRQSPYLEACIQSLRHQTVPSQLIISTSTPSDWLNEIGSRHDIPIVVRDGESSIADDWNFALTLGDTPLITLAHQDDIYHATYAEQIIAAARRHPDMLIAFTNMDLIMDGQTVNRTINRSIQRLLLFPYRLRGSLRSRFLRRLSIAFGNPISCPTVAYQRQNLRGFQFDRTFANNLDWEAWVRLASQPGAFVYVPAVLLSHRFHRDSETCAALASERRKSDDRRIFNLIWPKPLGDMLAYLYAMAYRSRHY